MERGRGTENHDTRVTAGYAPVKTGAVSACEWDQTEHLSTEGSQTAYPYLPITP